MQEVFVAVPVTPNAISGPLSTAALNPATVIGRLSASLQASDQFLILGSQDPSATVSSPNLIPIGNVLGNGGITSLSTVLGGWLNLFVKRLPNPGSLATPNQGAFSASGNASLIPAVSPVGASLPGLGTMVAQLSLSTLAGPVLVAPDANQTTSDVFAIFGTNDPSSTDPSKAVFLAKVQGGGSSAQSVFTGFSLLVTGYTYLLIARVSGSTPGNMYAWGATDSTSSKVSAPSKLNKGMAALNTTADGQAAVAAGIGATPVGWVGVRINGIGYDPGDGTKVGVACYFSGDGGTTARAQGAIQKNDTLYWNGSVAGFQLSTTDVVDFDFNA